MKINAATGAPSGRPSVLFRKGAIALAVATACASSAMAADSSRAPADEGLTEVVVTGSRIVRRDYSSPSPVVTVGQDTLQNSSEVSIDQALSKLPQFNPGSNQFNQAGNVQATAASSPGAATVNLRGLGANRNLVLLDGRRPQPANASLAVDVNTIPQAAIESVEIVSGGAGATYGADAMAGVVNFKLKKRFQGAEFDAQFGQSGHSDDRNESASALLGANIADNRGNVMLGLTYANRGTILVHDRPFFDAANTDPTVAGGAFPGFAGFNLFPYIPPGTPANDTPAGAAFNFPSQAAVDAVFAAKGYPAGTVAAAFHPLYFQTAATTAGASIFSQTHGAGGQKAPGYTGPTYPLYKYQANGDLATNNNPDGPLSTPLRRYSMFASGNYEINDNVSADLQGYFVRNEVKTSFGTPTPAVNQWGVQIPYDAAHPVPGDLKTLLDSRPNPNADWYLSQFPYFVGNRRMEVVTDTYQIQAGLKGNLGLKDWTWDVTGSIGSTDSVANYFGFLDRARYQELIKQPNYGAGYTASFGLIGRLATCTSGINPFVNTPVSQDCIDIVDGKLKTTTTLGQRSLEANFQGAGFNLPAGESRFAFGVDYRSNTIEYRPDPGMSKDNILSNAIGIFGAADVNGSASVKEVYGEADFPILANMAAAKKLELNVGYRYSDFDTKAGAVDTWKALLTWQLNDYVTFRGGPQRATRAPNIAEMFTPSTVLVTLWPTGDPCSTNTTPPGVPWANTAGNPNRAQVITLCNKLALGSAYATTLPANYPVNASYGGLGFYFPLALDQQVGNPDVKSEKGTTYTFGTVLKSPFESAVLSNLTATIDYYHIKIDGAITPLTSEIAYRQCFNANGISNPTYDVNNAYCQLIHRSPTGATDTVIGKFTNIGMLQTSGVDLNLDWRAMLSDIGIGLPGALNANLAYTKLIEYKVQVATGEAVTDYKGSSGFDSATGAQFSWKSLLGVGYTVGPANVTLRWRHLPSVVNAGKVLNPASTVYDTASNDQFDLYGGWRLTDNVSIRAGIENLLDKDPPIVGASPASTNAGNTDAGVYDIIGRRYFIGVKAKF